MPTKNLVPIEKIRPIRYQPHVLTNSLNMFGGTTTVTWSMLVSLLCFFEAVLMLLFFATLGSTIIFRLVIFNAVSFLSPALMIIIFVLWLWFAGHPQRLDDTINRYYFKKRVRKNIDKISIFQDKVTEEEIRRFTGIISYDPVSCLYRTLVNKATTGFWKLRGHPYKGNWFYVTVAKPNYTKTDHMVIIENLYSADKTFPPNHYKNTLMITGDTSKHVLAEFKKLIANPNIDKIQEQAIYSILDLYKDQETTKEPIYLILFGLPYTTKVEKARQYMSDMRAGYENTINVKGIKTELITDPLVLSMLIKGALTGKMWVRGNLIGKGGKFGH